MATPNADPLVCIVDDDPAVRRGLARSIRSARLQVEVFPSAKAFLDRLPGDGDRPLCLVLDVQMPGLSGLDLQAELARTGRGIPIVFITGHGDVPSTVQAMKGGAIDFLEKPFDQQDLLASIHRALDRSRQTRAIATERAEVERRLATLTSREREVLEILVLGLLNKQIADRLGAAEKTIKVHRGRIMQKMQAGSVAELVRMAEKVGIGPL